MEAVAPCVCLLLVIIRCLMLCYSFGSTLFVSSPRVPQRQATEETMPLSMFSWCPEVAFVDDVQTPL